MTRRETMGRRKSAAKLLQDSRTFRDYRKHSRRRDTPYEEVSRVGFFIGYRPKQEDIK